MARLAAILGALWTAVRRDAKTLGSFTGNNLFSVSLIFVFLGDPQASIALNLIIGLVLFFPLSTDPLSKIPPDRLALWPITPGERRLLRIVSPWLNPMTWILAALLLRRTVTMGLWALLAVLFAIGFVIPALPWARRNFAWRPLPHFPGALDQLIRKNLREILATLDFYCALLLSAGCLIYRVKGLLPPESMLPMTMLVMLPLSSYAQSLFGLDGEGGLTRYHLLPIAGWRLLAAKDAAYLMVSLILCLPLDPLAGLAGALVALAFGHHDSVTERRPQTRWRFSTGASFGSGLTQVALMALFAAATVNFSRFTLVACVAGYVWSTRRYGRALERSFG